MAAPTLADRLTETDVVYILGLHDGGMSPMQNGEG
jgi:hypothetical protein